VAFGVVHLGHAAMLAVSWNELGPRQSQDDVAVALARAAHGPNEVVAAADARWPTSNRNQWPASYWNAWPASSVSAARRIALLGENSLRSRPASKPSRMSFLILPNESSIGVIMAPTHKIPDSPGSAMSNTCRTQCFSRSAAAGRASSCARRPLPQVTELNASRSGLSLSEWPRARRAVAEGPAMRQIVVIDAERPGIRPGGPTSLISSREPARRSRGKAPVARSFKPLPANIASRHA
jgi:hypothetical protein